MGGHKGGCPLHGLIASAHDGQEISPESAKQKRRQNVVACVNTRDKPNARGDKWLHKQNKRRKLIWVHCTVKTQRHHLRSRRCSTDGTRAASLPNVAAWKTLRHLFRGKRKHLPARRPPRLRVSTSCCSCQPWSTARTTPESKRLPWRS